MIDINDFEQEVKCIYEDEKYTARDNGVVSWYPRDLMIWKPRWEFPLQSGHIARLFFVFRFGGNRGIVGLKFAGECIQRLITF